MKQRIRDWWHERAIRRQGRLAAEMQEFGTKGDARREHAKLTRMILDRSPEQVERMERARLARMDEHARATFERSRGQ